MIFLKDEDRPDIEKDIVIAVLCAIGAALATWAVDELKTIVKNHQTTKRDTHENDIARPSVVTE